ncbi:hypothetical protein KJ756_01515, partial [Patescibacteria group bacterium]|nr:hypothetical protein [Patescibacteria group bacterium]
DFKFFHDYIFNYIFLNEAGQSKNWRGFFHASLLYYPFFLIFTQIFCIINIVLDVLVLFTNFRKEEMFVF